MTAPAGDVARDPRNGRAEVPPTLAAIIDTRIIGIIRRPTAAEAAADIERLLAAGMRAVEVSLTTPRAVEVISAVAPGVRDGVHLGVGTVLGRRDVERAAAAGASFVVSPVSKPDMIAAAHECGLVSVMGAMTPTECITAAEAGADLLKLFPANLWSLKAMHDLLTALPDLRLVPTGGIRLGDAAAWLNAGAVAVGLGSSLSSISSDQALHDGIESLARMGGTGDQ